MRPIAEVLSLPFAFLQPKAMERSFELRAGEELAGTLAFRSSFGSLALARTAESAWTFKRVGSFSPRATARLEGSEHDLVAYTPRWSGQSGEITLEGGERLRFAAAGFWGTRFALSDAAGQTLATFGPEPEAHRFSDLFRAQAIVSVDPAASARSDLGLLLLFGWYLVILHNEDATTAATTVVVAG
jgi:hypothetical protein